jgi:protein-tyrosine phosphatase
MTPVPTQDAAVVLVICTGNTCRSPFVERVLRARLGAAAAQVLVGSAGTRAVDGAAMSLATRELVAAHGGDPDRFAARVLAPDLLEEADLVLALTREHRDDALRLRPGAAVVVLGALPRLLDARRVVVRTGPVAPRVRDLGAAAVAVAPADRPDDDVPDPFGLGPEGYAAAAQRMLPPVEALARWLGSPDRQPAGQ